MAEETTPQEAVIPEDDMGWMLNVDTGVVLWDSEVPKDATPAQIAEVARSRFISQLMDGTIGFILERTDPDGNALEGQEPVLINETE